MPVGTFCGARVQRLVAPTEGQAGEQIVAIALMSECEAPPLRRSSMQGVRHRPVCCYQDSMLTKSSPRLRVTAASVAFPDRSYLRSTSASPTRRWRRVTHRSQSGKCGCRMWSRWLKPSRCSPSMDVSM